MKFKERRAILPDKRKLRNLKQYKNMSNEEFDIEFDNVFVQAMVSTTEEELEERILNNLAELGEDYDLSDMKANDRLLLRALAMAEIQLTDLEKSAYFIRQEVNQTNVIMIEKLNNTMSKLRADISKISDDLQLTRRIRKQSQELSVINYIEDLREKAHQFYKQKMLYIFCPECRYLLSTLWLLYSEEDNSINLKCKHCGHKFTQPLAGLYLRNNKNLEDVVIP